MKRGFRIGVVLLVIVLLIVGGVFLIKQKEKELQTTGAYGGRPRPVTVFEAKKGDLHIENEYLAVVEPFEEVRVSARVTAEVKQVFVDEGDRVKAGSVLAELDAEEIEHRIASAEASIEQARADLRANRATVQALETSSAYWQAEKERDRTLADKGAISPVQAEKTAEMAADIKGKLAAARQKSNSILQQIEVREQQKAELASMRSYYTLTSPFSGRVSERMADVGDMATPGRDLLVIQNQKRLKISFDVPQKDLPELNNAKAVSFSVGGNTRTAPLSVMHPSLDKAKMLRVEAWPQPDTASGLTPGAYLPVNVSITELENVIVIPASALIEGPEGQDNVFAVIDGRLRAKPIEILGRTGDKVAVKGIDAETLVVENTYLGWATLSSGEIVEAVK